MKCYKMHDGGNWVPLVDAVTIFQGYAVCSEHLEEMVAGATGITAGSIPFVSLSGQLSGFTQSRLYKGISETFGHNFEEVPDAAHD